MNLFESTTQSLCHFIQSSPTAFHAVHTIKELLLKQGFTQLYENSHWELHPGGHYMVIRGGSSLIAFCLPEKDPSHFQLIASHSDSPMFKIKESPEILKAGHYVELNIEKYGGMLCAPWYDRPLGIAGRVMVQSEKGLYSCLVDANRDLAMIPSLAIHMNRNANETASCHVQSDMLPVFGDETCEGTFSAFIAQLAGVKKEQIAASDLFLYNRTHPSLWGACSEFFSSPRLDDLQCAYASVQALIGSSSSDPCNSQGTDCGHRINVCCVFDHEEVGSGTKQGADSTFLQDVLERISLSLNKPREDFLRMLAGSFLLSADNSHAVHPNHMEKADPVNRPSLNGGVVLKFNANQKYTTDAVSAAVFRDICRKAGVPVQDYANHSDIAGGSTLGNISSSHISIDTVDIGCPQLAMHSPYETTGVKDTWYMIQAMQTFYQSEIVKEPDGMIRIISFQVNQQETAG